MSPASSWGPGPPRGWRSAVRPHLGLRSAQPGPGDPTPLPRNPRFPPNNSFPPLLGLLNDVAVLLDTSQSFLRSLSSSEPYVAPRKPSVLLVGLWLPLSPLGLPRDFVTSPSPFGLPRRSSVQPGTPEAPRDYPLALGPPSRPSVLPVVILAALCCPVQHPFSIPGLPAISLCIARPQPTHGLLVPHRWRTLSPISTR